MRIYHILGAIIRFFDPNPFRLYCDACKFRRAKNEIKEVVLGSGQGEYMVLCDKCRMAMNRAKIGIKKDTI